MGIGKEGWDVTDTYMRHETATVSISEKPESWQRYSELHGKRSHVHISRGTDAMGTNYRLQRQRGNAKR